MNVLSYVLDKIKRIAFCLFIISSIVLAMYSLCLYLLVFVALLYAKLGKLEQNYLTILDFLRIFPSRRPLKTTSDGV